jgi:hypothetical protein
MVKDVHQKKEKNVLIKYFISTDKCNTHELLKSVKKSVKKRLVKKCSKRFILLN